MWHWWCIASLYPAVSLLVLSFFDIGIKSGKCEIQYDSVGESFHPGNSHENCRTDQQEISHEVVAYAEVLELQREHTHV